MNDSRIRSHQWDKYRSNFGVPARELDRKGREYELEVPPIREVPRTEEGCPKLSICKHPLCDRLRDRALPRPGKPVQPVDRRFVEIPCPVFDLIQDSSTGPFETTITATVSIFGCLRAAEIVEDDRFSCRQYISATRCMKRKTFGPGSCEEKLVHWFENERKILTIRLHP